MSKYKRVEKAILENLYIDRGLSARQIVPIVGVSKPVILSRLRKYGIPVRSTGEGKHLRSANHCNLTQKAIEWISGELLGDGSLKSQSRFSAKFRYGSKYSEYISYVSDTLCSFGIQQSGKIKARTTKIIAGIPLKKPSTVYHYESLDYPELFPLYKKWYPDGKKIVPEDIELTPLVARQWYIGDGCLEHPPKEGAFIKLYTNGFTHGDVEFLALKLKEIGIWATRQPSRNTIRISGKYTKKFLNYLGSCPVECYEYKWDLEGKEFHKRKLIKIMKELKDD